MLPACLPVSFCDPARCVQKQLTAFKQYSCKRRWAQMQPAAHSHLTWCGCRLRAALATPGSMTQEDHAKAVQLGLTPGSSNPLGMHRPQVTV